MRRAWRHATAVPVSLQSAIAEIEGPTEAAWNSARRNNDFQGFVAPLTTLLNLQIEALKIKAAAFSLAPYDTLLEEYEPGLRQAILEPLFDDLAGFLPELVREVTDKQRTAPDPIPLSGPSRTISNITSVKPSPPWSALISSTVGSTRRPIRLPAAEFRGTFESPPAFTPTRFAKTSLPRFMKRDMPCMKRACPPTGHSNP